MTGSLALAWQFSPTITCGMLLTGCVYAVGRQRRHAAVIGAERRRGVLFFGGLAMLYSTLQSPLDAMADHLFSVHQVQHLALLEFVPMLLVAAEPQASLIAGLPRAVRHGALAPVFRIYPIRRTFAFLVHPAVAASLFALMPCLWNLPSVHDAAILNERLHDLMHFSMLSSGLLFWWRILDHRSPPAGSPPGVRFFMLQAGMMGMTLAGGYLMAKQTVLYDVYDRYGLGMSAIADEAIGGAVLWLAGSVAPIATAVVILHRMLGRIETADGSPETSRRR